MAQRAVGPFEAYANKISNPSGGLARYHAIRNLEAMNYTIGKNTVTPYGLERINEPMQQDILEQYGAQGQDVLAGINEWIRESPYPAYYDGSQGLSFPGWNIGRDKHDDSLILENTNSNIAYPLSADVLDTLDVNRPFDVVPAWSSPQPQGQVRPPGPSQPSIAEIPDIVERWQVDDPLVFPSAWSSTQPQGPIPTLEQVQQQVETQIQQPVPRTLTKPEIADRMEN